jgi:hypothetical protein
MDRRDAKITMAELHVDMDGVTCQSPRCKMSRDADSVRGTVRIG